MGQETVDGLVLLFFMSQLLLDESWLYHDLDVEWKPVWKRNGKVLQQQPVFFGSTLLTSNIFICINFPNNSPVCPEIFQEYF